MNGSDTRSGYPLGLKSGLVIGIIVNSEGGPEVMKYNQFIGLKCFQGEF